jgi:hypothetical protein
VYCGLEVESLSAHQIVLLQDPEAIKLVYFYLSTLRSIELEYSFWLSDVPYTIATDFVYRNCENMSILVGEQLVNNLGVR